jgi:dihydroxy-acid dehydratase
VVGHISPEAEMGGPIALIEDGDEITIDANADILSLNISDDEMKRRLENWQNPNSSPKSGVLAKYKKTVQSASQGAITD